MSVYSLLRQFHFFAQLATFCVYIQEARFSDPNGFYIDPDDLQATTGSGLDPRKTSRIWILPTFDLFSFDIKVNIFDILILYLHFVQ